MGVGDGVAGAGEGDAAGDGAGVGDRAGAVPAAASGVEAASGAVAPPGAGPAAGGRALFRERRAGIVTFSGGGAFKYGVPCRSPLTDFQRWVQSRTMSLTALE